MKRRWDDYRHLGALEDAAGWLRHLPIAAFACEPLRRLYHRALSAATLGAGLRRRLPSGDVVFVSPSHRHINWNPIEFDAFHREIVPGAIALDIGANVGAYALLLGRWVGPAGRVFAFEPAPSAYAGLAEHIRLNHLSDRVTPVRSAVGAEVGTVPFIVAPTAGEGRLATDRSRPASLDVAVTTVDAFCANAGILPDFIKVDVEGAELDVLRGACETIARTKGRLALFVELHPALWPERGLSRVDLEREIDRLGLVVESLVPNADPWTLEGVTARLVAKR